MTMEVWRGASLLDGAPIVLLISGYGRRPSSNAKTGPMLQTWILRQDVAPHVAQKDGSDSAICGTCPLRPAVAVGASCYVVTFQGPRSSWQSWKSGTCDPFDASQLAGRKLRRGSYGEPAAVPLEVWDELQRACDVGTGYTHAWPYGPSSLSLHLMASVESSSARAEAKAMGYRTFRVLQHGDTLESGERLCPARKGSPTSTTCEKCGLCGGTSHRSKLDVAIPAH